MIVEFNRAELHHNKVRGASHGLYPTQIPLLPLQQLICLLGGPHGIDLPYQQTTIV